MSYIERMEDHPFTTDLQDMVNNLQHPFRKGRNIREMFEAMIVSNTSVDEPGAPPITVSNSVNNQQCPTLEFFYSNNLYCGDEVTPTKPSDLQGCTCRGQCDPDDQNCQCAKRQENATRAVEGFEDHRGFMYTESGKIREQGLPIYECNALCRCSSKCSNRVSRPHKFIDLSQLHQKLSRSRKKADGSR